MENNIEEDVKKKLEEQKKIQERQLKIILGVIGSIIVIFLVGLYGVDSIKNFEYKNIDFEIVKYCDARPCLVLYKASVPRDYLHPVTGKVTQIDYVMNLRNDPRKLESVPFEGDIDLSFPIKKMILETEYEEICQGDVTIAKANMIQAFKIMGIDIYKDENAMCDPEGRYMHVKIVKGDETKIEETSNNCYTISIKDCEILKGTERFMLEAFSDFAED